MTEGTATVQTGEVMPSCTWASFTQRLPVRVWAPSSAPEAGSCSAGPEVRLWAPPCCPRAQQPCSRLLLADRVQAGGSPPFLGAPSPETRGLVGAATLGNQSWGLSLEPAQPCGLRRYSVGCSPSFSDRVTALAGGRETRQWQTPPSVLSPPPTGSLLPRGAVWELLLLASAGTLGHVTSG